MNSSELQVQLRALSACKEAVVWSKGRTFAEAWQQCKRADWMLWLCGKMCGAPGWPTQQQIVLLACECAESSLPLFEQRYPNDQRPRKAIEAARAWANGDGTIEQVRTARAAAYAYADDAAAAADAGRVHSLVSLPAGAEAAGNFSSPISSGAAHTTVER